MVIFELNFDCDVECLGKIGSGGGAITAGFYWIRVV